MAIQCPEQLGRQVSIAAVVVHAGIQVEAADGSAQQPLGRTQHIGSRHQDDLAPNTALAFQTRQFAAQVHPHQQTRDFIGV